MRTEDQQVRELLTAAAEVPDEVSPPIAQLIRHGHRNRARRTLTGAIAVVVAVIAAPSLVAGLGLLSGGVTGNSAASSGPTAAQLARYRWSAVAPSPIGRSGLSIVVLAGRQLLEVGAQRNGHSSTASAVYDPAANHWRMIAQAPRSIDPESALTAWTGRQLLIIGKSRSCPALGASRECVPQIELYNPAASTWSTSALPGSLGQLSKLDPMAITWTGSQVVVAGSAGAQGRLGVVAYSPATGRWQVITPTLAASHPLWALGLASVDHHLILWSSWVHQKLVNGLPKSHGGVDVFSRDDRGKWSSRTASWPQSQTVSGPVVTQRGVLVPPEPFGLTSHGYFTDPGTFAMTAISPGPVGNAEPAYLWTGRVVIAFAKDTGGTVRPGATADYDPVTRHWHSLPDAALALSGKGAPGFTGSPVWTGTEVLQLSSNGQLLAFRR